ncbi:MAG: hypothetical protein JWO11_771 [Nocardioides sp.]|nr:hypothetical protein [Nocardioides sp.]
MTKWGDRPHWEFDGILLGADEHGDWIGFPAGTHMSRPGATYVAPVAQVGLVPAPGAPVDRGWLATFHAPGGVVTTYVDMTTPPEWDGAVLRAVDLDLDVVRLPEGDVGVDDEDEFEAHRVRYSYPEDVVALAITSCERILTAITEEDRPFDGTAEAWLARVPPLPSGG